MGCDIHCFIEYKEKKNQNWNSFGDRFNPGRDYGMFATLANVRNYDGQVENYLNPKGLPESISWRAKHANSLYVNDEYCDEEGNCSLESAERWVKEGSSVWVQDKTRVSHPDWHSHSWVNQDEYKNLLEGWQKVAKYKVDVNYRIILAIMDEYVKQGYEVRLVFWFDN